MVYWSTDYSKIDDAHVDQDFARSIIDRLIQQLQVRLCLGTALTTTLYT